MRFALICLTLAIVAYLNLELSQMDVKTAFLNGELDEETCWLYSKRGRAQSLQAPTIHLWLETIIRQWYFKFHRVTSNRFMMLRKTTVCMLNGSRLIF